MDKKINLEHTIRNIVSESLGAGVTTDKFKGTQKAFLQPAPQIKPKVGDAHPDGSATTAKRGLAKINQSETMKEEDTQEIEVFDELENLKEFVDTKNQYLKKTGPEMGGGGGASKGGSNYASDLLKNLLKPPAPQTQNTGSLRGPTIKADPFKTVSKKTKTPTKQEVTPNIRSGQVQTNQAAGTNSSNDEIVQNLKNYLSNKQYQSDVERTLRYSTKLAAKTQAKKGFGDTSGGTVSGLPQTNPKAKDSTIIPAKTGVEKANIPAGKLPAAPADAKGTKDLAGLTNLPMPRADVKGTKDITGLTNLPMPRADVKGTSAFTGMPTKNTTALQPPPAFKGIETIPDDRGYAKTQTDELLKQQQLASAASKDVTSPPAAPATGTPGQSAASQQSALNNPWAGAAAAAAAVEVASAAFRGSGPRGRRRGGGKGKDTRGRKRDRDDIDFDFTDRKQGTGQTTGTSGLDSVSPENVKTYLHRAGQRLADRFAEEYNLQDAEEIKRKSRKAQIIRKIIDEQKKKKRDTSTVDLHPKLKNQEPDQN